MLITNGDKNPDEMMQSLADKAGIPVEEMTSLLAKSMNMNEK